LTDAYKILRTQVLHRVRENRWNVLGVTSAGKQEGKTTVAINLGISLAMEGNQTVLLVDTDLRAPRAHHAFGLKEGRGLVDYLLDGVPVDNLLVNPDIDRFVLLPGGRAVTGSTELLTSPRMLALAKELKHRYPSRLVLFDLPPLLDAADALAFSPHLDAMLLVIDAGRTQAEQLEQAVRLLKGTPIIGTVLNKG
jgi:capsular exopolysaccharide synthesis family protein